MNSVIGSGDNILFLHQGERWWEGNNISLFESTNEELDSFIFASEFLKEAKTARLIKNQNK